MFVCSSFRVYCVDRMVLENYFCVRCGHVLHKRKLPAVRKCHIC